MESFAAFFELSLVDLLCFRALFVELVEAEGLGALVKTMLVADDLARIEGRMAPGGVRCCMAVEAMTMYILGLL
jgi:hypothetical protein